MSELSAFDGRYSSFKGVATSSIIIKEQLESTNPVQPEVAYPVSVTPPLTANYVEFKGTDRWVRFDGGDAADPSTLPSHTDNGQFNPEVVHLARLGGGNPMFSVWSTGPVYINFYD
jgi:hypothetical protein